MIKNILIGIATSIALSLLAWIGVNTMDVEPMKEKIQDLKEQSIRHDELFQQEMDKRVLLEKQLLELQWELKNIKSK